MKKLIFILFVSLSLIQCSSDDITDCSTVLCVGPEFVFEFIDADTGENVLEGLFDTGAPDGFSVVLGEDNSTLDPELDYTLNPLGQLTLFRFSEQFQISFENVFDVTIAYDFETISDGGCCQGFRYENVTTSNATFEQIEDEVSLILRVFI